MFYFNSANDSKVEKFKNYLKIQTNNKIWDNSIIVPLNYIGIKKNSFLKIKCSVLSGKIGIGLVGDNFSKYLFNETYVDKKSDSNIQIPVNTKSKNLIIRNVSNNISKYKLYKIKNISEKESQKLSSFSNLENKNIEEIFLSKNWTSAKNLIDEPILPFISKFKPNFPFEESFKIFVTSAKSLKNCYFDYKKTPLLIFPILQKILKIKKPIYWDIGANLGASTIQIAKKIKKNSGQVVAFECEPDNFFSLQKNFQINELNDSIVLPIALGKKNSINQLNLNNSLLLNHKNQKNMVYNFSGLGLHTLKNKKNNNVNIWGKYKSKINILMMTADYLVESKILSTPNYIFIDAALYEQDIVKGMKNILQNKSKPAAILIEQTPGGASGDKSSKIENTFIAKELSHYGYRALEIENYNLKKFNKRHIGNYFMSLFYNLEMIDKKIIDRLQIDIKSDLDLINSK
jgi:FkbM family methyltransferase